MTRIKRKPKLNSLFHFILYEVYAYTAYLFISYFYSLIKLKKTNISHLLILDFINFTI
jgi:hypothetical protein